MSVRSFGRTARSLASMPAALALLVSTGSGLGIPRSGGVAALAEAGFSCGYENDNPVWMPSGERIVFYSNREGNFEIYMMEADGSDVRRLTRTEADEIEPVPSPDGRRIAFARRVEGEDTELWTLDLDSGRETRLTRDPGNDLAPAWSPDGAWIAFQSSRTGRYEIHLIPATGGELRRVTDLGDHAHRPSWAPSGDRLAFVFEGHGDSELYTVARDGTSPRRLTRSPERTEFAPTWSPDGSRIAYMARSGEVRWQIHVMRADGTGNRRLTCRATAGE